MLAFNSVIKDCVFNSILLTLIILLLNNKYIIKLYGKYQNRFINRLYVLINKWSVYLIDNFDSILNFTTVTEPHCRGLHRRAPCSRVHLAYSLYQLRVGISPPYALDPYDRLRNVLQTPQIHMFYSHCLRPITLRYAFFITNTQPITNSMSL